MGGKTFNIDGTEISFRTASFCGGKSYPCRFVSYYFRFTTLVFVSLFSILITSNVSAQYQAVPSGYLIISGKVFKPPYVFGVENNRVTVNGIGLTPYMNETEYKDMEKRKTEKQTTAFNQIPAETKKVEEAKKRIWTKYNELKDKESKEQALMDIDAALKTEPLITEFVINKEQELYHVIWAGEQYRTTVSLKLEDFSEYVLLTTADKNLIMEKIKKGNIFEMLKKGYCVVLDSSGRVYFSEKGNEAYAKILAYQNGKTPEAEAITALSEYFHGEQNAQQILKSIKVSR